MRERSNSLAVLLSLSSSSSERSKRVLMRLYCCVISTLSKSVVDVMAVATRRPSGPRVRRGTDVEMDHVCNRQGDDRDKRLRGWDRKDGDTDPNTGSVRNVLHLWLLSDTAEQQTS